MLSDAVNYVDYYEVLGIPRDATQQEIKKAYYAMSLQAHPDKVNGNESAQKMINKAYDTLKDPEQRALYDLGNAPTDAILSYLKLSFFTPFKSTSDCAYNALVNPIGIPILLVSVSVIAAAVSAITLLINLMTSIRSTDLNSIVDSLTFSLIAAAISATCAAASVIYVVLGAISFVSNTAATIYDALVPFEQQSSSVHTDRLLILAPPQEEAESTYNFSC